MGEPAPADSQTQIVPTQQAPRQITLDDVLARAEPLVRQWSEVERDKNAVERERHKHDADLERAHLLSSEKQNILLGVGIFIVILLLLLIAGGLFLAGRDAIAM